MSVSQIDSEVNMSKPTVILQKYRLSREKVSIGTMTVSKNVIGLFF